MFTNIGNNAENNSDRNKKNETNCIFLYIEEDEEDKLELESWMMNENFWNVEKEEEDKLELESWMIDEKIWK